MISRPDQLEFHISDIRRWLSCRQQWQFASPLAGNWESPRPNRHLWLGSAVHYALAAYHSGLGVQGAIASYDQWCSRQMKAIKDVAEPALMPEILEELDDAYKLGYGMLQAYGDYARAHNDFTVVMPEIRFKVPFEIPRYDHPYQCIFAGTNDGLIKDTQGRYWLLEHKTTRELTTGRKNGWRSLWYDMQAVAYVWAAHQSDQFVKTRPKGVMFNMLRKKVPQVPTWNKNGTLSRAALDTTYETMYECLVGMGEPVELYKSELDALLGAPNSFFERIWVPVDLSRIVVFESYLMSMARDMISADIYPSPGPLGWNCNNCSFTEPCMISMSGKGVEGLLKANYRQRTIEPFAAEAESEGG